jgi:ferritin-like metal-binding protein YciE
MGHTRGKPPKDQAIESHLQESDTMKLGSLNDLFVEELKDIYDAEKQLTKALPKMAKEASSQELAEAFQEHLEVTEGQVDRLEQIFKSIGESPGRKKCEGMKGLIEEGEEMMDKEANEPVKDAALIAAAQKVEHYEMASYGCLRTWAELLGNKEVAELLQETLDEEGEADKKLTQIAEALNIEADSGDDEDGDMADEDEGEATSARRARRK